MKRKIKYAILKYIPNFERNETINTAVVIHSPSENKISMQIIDNWKRIKSFDDEANIPFLKKYVQDMEYEFTNPFTKLYNTKNIDNINLLDDITKYFVNKFSFEIHIIDTDESYSNIVKNIKNIYLYYEIPQNKRQQEQERRREFEKNLLEYNICCG